MATNKHATIRYQTLDRCFKNSGRRYYIVDLIEACNKALYDYTGVEDGVKRRQVYEDITFMESTQGWSIPLERVRDGHKVFFRYGDRSFSINSQPLNETEQNQLKEALLTLSRFKGMPQFEWVDELTARLESGMKLSKHTGHIIEFEQNRNLRGLEYITPAYNAILNSKTLKVEYQGFKQEKSDIFYFYPYFLKQFNNRWFLFGGREHVDYMINLALDRIAYIEESTKLYKANKHIDFSTYFNDVIGVTIIPDISPERIVLRFSGNRFPYIKTKPIHLSQRILEEKLEYGVIEICVIPNNELEAILLSYGEDVEVVLPQTLRTTIKSKVMNTLRYYQA